MIFIRFIIKNILLSFLLTSLVLIVILASNLALRLLTEIYEDGVYTGHLVRLIGLNLIDDLPLLLPLCLLIGIFLSFNKLHRSLELTAMQSLGVGTSEVFRAILIVSIPLSILAGVVSLYIAPISMQWSEKYKNEFDLSNHLTSLSSQSFSLSADKKNVIYVDENNQIISEIDDKNPPMSGVFIFSDLTEEKQNSKHRIIVSHEARQNTKQTGSVEHRYLELLDGKIYTFENNRLKELLEFETYEIVLSAKSNEATLSQSYKALPSMQLLESPNKRLQAEFYLRLSSPICILMASFLALVFAQFQPRT